MAKFRRTAPGVHYIGKQVIKMGDLVEMPEFKMKAFMDCYTLVEGDILTEEEKSVVSRRTTNLPSLKRTRKGWNVIHGITGEPINNEPLIKEEAEKLLVSLIGE